MSADARSAATGDIPDNQVFLVFTDKAGGFSIKYPEGWTQSGSPRDVTFRDKNNLVHVVIATGAAPTPTSVAAQLNALKQADPTLSFRAPRTVAIGSGPVVKAVYTTESAPNPVTGKRVKLIVDRYELAGGGRVATRGSGDAGGRGQRRCLPDDDRELPVAVSAGGGSARSLWREPERAAEQVDWPALQFHDVFKIYPLRPG